MMNRWNGVLVGTVVAIASKLMLILLGVGVGLLVFPFSRTGDHWVWQGFAVGSALYFAVAIGVSYFIGGFIASRLHRTSDRAEICFQGLALWGTTLCLVSLLGTAVFFAAWPSAEKGITAVAAVEAMQRVKPRIVTDLSLLKGKAVTVLDFGVTPNQLAKTIENSANSPQAEEAADMIRKATTALSLMGFGAMLLAMLTSVTGAYFGNPLRAAQRELAQPQLSRFDIHPARSTQ